MPGTTTLTFQAKIYLPYVISVLDRPFWRCVYGLIRFVYGQICDEITNMLYKAVKDVCFPPPSLYNEVLTLSLRNSFLGLTEFTYVIFHYVLVILLLSRSERVKRNVCFVDLYYKLCSNVQIFPCCVP